MASKANKSSNSPKLQPAQKVGGVRMKNKKAHPSPKQQPPVPQPIDKTFQTLAKVELPPSLNDKKQSKAVKQQQYPGNKHPPAKQINEHKKHSTHNIQQPKQGF